MKNIWIIHSRNSVDYILWDTVVLTDAVVLCVVCPALKTTAQATKNSTVIIDFIFESAEKRVSKKFSRYYKRQKI